MNSSTKHSVNDLKAQLSELEEMVSDGVLQKVKAKLEAKSADTKILCHQLVSKIRSKIIDLKKNLKDLKDDSSDKLKEEAQSKINSAKKMIADLNKHIS